MFLKTLVGLACVAAIAVVSYYFWNEFQAAGERDRVASYLTDRDECLGILDRHMNAASTSPRTYEESRDCIDRGLVTNKDIQARN